MLKSIVFCLVSILFAPVINGMEADLYFSTVLDTLNPPSPYAEIMAINTIKNINDPVILRQLISNKKYGDLKGETLLTYAIKKAMFDLTKALIQKEAGISTPNTDGKYPIMLILEKKPKGALGSEFLIFKKLLEKGPQINVSDNDGNTPLMYAVKNFLPTYTNTLIQEGAEINATNKHKKTALIIAAESRKLDATQALLKAKADPDAQDRTGNTALIIAAKNGDSSLIEEFINNHARIGIENKKQENALSILKEKAPKDKKLTELYKQLYERYKNQSSQLRVSIVEDILEGNISGLTKRTVNFVDPVTSLPPLMLIIKNKKLSPEKKISTIKQLIERGADVNISITEGDVQNLTPIFMAIMSREPNILQQLIVAGADLDATISDQEISNKPMKPAELIDKLMQLTENSFEQKKMNEEFFTMLKNRLEAMSTILAKTTHKKEFRQALVDARIKGKELLEKQIEQEQETERKRKQEAEYQAFVESIRDTPKTETTLIGYDTDLTDPNEEERKRKDKEELEALRQSVEEAGDVGKSASEAGAQISQDKSQPVGDIDYAAQTRKSIEDDLKRTKLEQEKEKTEKIDSFFQAIKAGEKDKIETLLPYMSKENKLRGLDKASLENSFEGLFGDYELRIISDSKTIELYTKLVKKDDNYKAAIGFVKHVPNINALGTEGKSMLELSITTGSTGLTNAILSRKDLKKEIIDAVSEKFPFDRTPQEITFEELVRVREKEKHYLLLSEQRKRIKDREKPRKIQEDFDAETERLRLEKQKQQARSVGTLAAQQAAQAALVKQAVQRRLQWKKDQTQRLELQKQQELAREEERKEEQLFKEAEKKEKEAVVNKVEILVKTKQALGKLQENLGMLVGILKRFEEQ